MQTLHCDGANIRNSSVHSALNFLYNLNNNSRFQRNAPLYRWRLGVAAHLPVFIFQTRCAIWLFQNVQRYFLTAEKAVGTAGDHTTLTQAREKRPCPNPYDPKVFARSNDAQLLL
jgi:hypothetical protein